MMNDEKNRDDEVTEEFEIEDIITEEKDDVKDAPVTSIDTKALKNELDKSKNDFLYLKAEFDNYKKRAMKERSDYLRYSGEQAFTSILDVLDNFERALQIEVTPENLESFKRGVELISENLKSVLKKFGVAEVPSEGVPFDPHMHEAISSEETDEVPEGNISKVFRKTYKMHDKVIRTGQVVVAKPKSETKE